MLHNRTFAQFTAGLLVLATISMLGWWQLAAPAAAQDETETPQDETETPIEQQPSQPAPITVTGINPVQVTRGQASELIISGTNFTADLTVQINQQIITPNLLDDTHLSLMLPANLATGDYPITVIQPGGNPVSAPAPLQVIDPPPTHTPTNTPRPPIQVTRSEPTAANQGVEVVLSVFGSGFSATSTVRLVGVGLLETTFVNDGAVKAILPVTAPAGVYRIEVADDRGVWVASPNTLMIMAPTATPPIPPTATERMDPTPTLPAATPLPGQPSLAVRNFSATPAVTAPGGTVTLNFEVVNQGNRTAQGVVVSLDTGSKFVPANGQASATLPNLNPGARQLVALAVVAGMDAPKGPNPIPITLAYYDFEGTALTSKATLSVTISELAEASQVVLSNYTIDPDPVLPGQKVTVTGTITNTGNAVAAQVLMRIAGDNSILLSGSQGDSLPLGDLQPGASADISLELVVSSSAKDGAQGQPVKLSYLQDGEAKEVATSLTINVAKADKPAPLMLLAAYDVGADHLQPGDQFTLKMTLHNVGRGDASNMLVTFGTVETTSNPGLEGTPGGMDQSSTTPSTTFAPIGAGGTLYVGEVGAEGGEVTLTQDFIVNGSTTSGIYSLPITLRYQKPDGTEAKEEFKASVVVIALPRLSFSLQSPLPETVNVGEPFAIPLTVGNTGTTTIAVKSVTAEAENGEVIEGADTAIEPLKTDDDTTVNVMVMALDEGPVKVTLTLHYTNDLNQDATIVQSYEVSAMLSEPMPEDMFPQEEMPTEPTEEEKEDNDSVGRILLGLLGLGS